MRLFLQNTCRAVEQHLHIISHFFRITLAILNNQKRERERERHVGRHTHKHTEVMKEKYRMGENS